MAAHGRVTIDGFDVIGVAARTSNQRETNPTTARIPGLWQRLLGEGMFERVPNKTGDPALYAVYTDYESDFTGEYRLLVGARVASLREIPPDMEGISVPAGEYLDFAASGNLPSALIETWSAIWDYFSTATEQRAYTTDVEIHQPGGEAIDILIAVK